MMEEALRYVPHHRQSLKTLATLVLLKYKRGVDCIPKGHLRNAILEADELKALYAWARNVTIRRPETVFLQLYTRQRTLGFFWHVITLSDSYLLTTESHVWNVPLPASRAAAAAGSHSLLHVKICTALKTLFESKSLHFTGLPVYGLIHMDFEYKYKQRHGNPIRQSVPLFFALDNDHEASPLWNKFEKDLLSTLAEVQTRFRVLSLVYFDAQ